MPSKWCLIWLACAVIDGINGEALMLLWLLFAALTDPVKKEK